MTWAADENILIVNWVLIAITLRRVGVPLSISQSSQYYNLGC